MVVAFLEHPNTGNKSSVSIFRILPNRVYAAFWRYNAMHWSTHAICVESKYRKHIHNIEYTQPKLHCIHVVIEQDFEYKIQKADSEHNLKIHLI